MIGYVLLGTNHLDLARNFYDRLLDMIGAARVTETEKMTAWGLDRNQPIFAIIKPYDGMSASAGNGTMIAFPMASRDLVDRFYMLALELGAKDEGGPGVRGVDDGLEFYAAYFRDLDGNKLAAVRFGDA